MEEYNKVYFLKRWEDSVKRNPEIIALQDPAHPQGYSRAEVDQRAGRVCTYLKKHGIGPGKFVMIYMSRSIDVLVAVLGVFKAGAVCTIMEDHYPRERVLYIMKAADCKLELNNEAFAQSQQEEAAEGYIECDPHTPAFAVFTSGSTGNPKGVLHEYGNLGHIMDSVWLPEGPKEFALIAPLNFVATMLAFARFLKEEELKFHVLPYDIVKNPKKLAQYVITKKISYIFVSPSMLRAANNLIGLPLKAILTGSEAATDVYNPTVPIINIYCMSETGFALTQFTIDRPYKNCPVGKCMTGTHEVFLVKEDGSRIENAGEEGEICVENPYVRGYIGLPQETAKAFVNGIYHTNDLGRYDENGNIVYIGRLNDMFKINGNRVEPGEIEAVAKEALGIDWCAARCFSGQSTYIALYYTADITFDEEEIRHKMEQKLPYYMIPAYFVKIEEIPLTPTGKFNRRALPQPAVKLNFAPYVPPADEMEKKLCDTFAKVLKVPKIGIDDDFYQLGGDSLRSMDVIAEINSDDLTAEDLYKGRTPREIARIYYENLSAHQGSSWQDNEEEARLQSYPLTGVEKKYVEEIFRQPGQLGANLSRLVAFPLLFDAEKIAASMNRMIHNRPVWGTVYYYDEQHELKQKYDPSKLPEVVVEEMTEAQFEAEKGNLLPAFEPLSSIMGVARVIRTEKKIYVLMGMSHAKIDGFGERILWKDLIDAYQGKELSADSYYSCLAESEENRKTENYAEAKEYFDRTYAKTDWQRVLTPDQETGDYSRAFHFEKLNFSLAQVEEAERRLGASRNAIFAAITLAAIAKTCHNRKVMLNWTYQDRSGRKKENAAGLMMKRLPIALDFDNIPDFKAGLESIKEQIIEGIANASYEWICENEDGLTNDIQSFVYQPASIMSTDKFASIGAEIVSGVLKNPGTARKFAVMVLEGREGLKSLVNYMKGYYSEQAIENFAKTYVQIAQKVVIDENSAVFTFEDIIKM